MQRKNVLSLQLNINMGFTQTCNVSWKFAMFKKCILSWLLNLNSHESLHFLNIANFHTLHVCVKPIFSCNKKPFFLCIYSFCFFRNSTFFHSGYVIKDPLTETKFFVPELLWNSDKEILLNFKIDFFTIV